MSIYRTVSTLFAAGFGVALYCGPVLAADAPETVIFVCKYGSVKSLVATERFNRMAEQQGLKVRAISRAANPENLHTKIPPLVVKQMALEGYQVAEVKPQVITPEEAAKAVRVVHISLQGEEDPISAIAKTSARVPLERWDDVPSMLRPSDASGLPTGGPDLTGRTYQKTRGLLIPHVDALFEELAKKSSSVAAK